MIREHKGEVIGRIDVETDHDKKMTIHLNPSDADKGNIYVAEGQGWKRVGSIKTADGNRRRFIRDARKVAKTFEDRGILQRAYIKEATCGAQ